MISKKKKGKRKICLPYSAYTSIYELYIDNFNDVHKTRKEKGERGRKKERTRNKEQRTGNNEM